MPALRFDHSCTSAGAYWKLAPLLPPFVYSPRPSVKSGTTGFQLRPLYPSANPDPDELYRLPSLVGPNGFQWDSNRGYTKVTTWPRYPFPKIRASIFWLYEPKRYPAWTLVLIPICQPNCDPKPECGRLLNNRVFFIQNRDRGINSIFQSLKKLPKSLRKISFHWEFPSLYPYPISARESQTSILVLYLIPEPRMPRPTRWLSFIDSRFNSHAFWPILTEAEQLQVLISVA